jgi:hypothetical protein
MRQIRWKEWKRYATKRRNLRALGISSGKGAAEFLLGRPGLEDVQADLATVENSLVNRRMRDTHVR